jgi:hypothetical protein
MRISHIPLPRGATGGGGGGGSHALGGGGGGGSAWMDAVCAVTAASALRVGEKGAGAAGGEGSAADQQDGLNERVIREQAGAFTTGFTSV